MEFRKIEEYMMLSREERQSHLNLFEECVDIGGYDSREYRGLLAHYLKTEIPTGKKVVLCHACNNHWCSNPKHLYWGTYGENIKDAQDAGRRPVSKRPKPSRTQAEVQSASRSLIGDLASLDKTHWGWVMDASRKLGVSHTHIRRIARKMGWETKVRKSPSRKI